MPAAKRPLPSDPDDVWRHHEVKIRKLYTCGKNTVEYVKSVMEDTEGFPKLAIPTWIEKLGQLGIRKNVLAEEWRKIYRHSLPRLEDPSRKKGDHKLKRTKKKTEVVVRGRTYNWDQAWKNMKSSNAIGQLPRRDESLSPLPPEFVIRTPPLASRSIVPASRGALRERAFGTGDLAGNSPIFCDHARGYQPANIHSGDEEMALAPSGHFRPGFIRSMVKNAEEVWKHCLAGLPIAAVIHHELKIAHPGTPSGTFAQGFRQYPGRTNPFISVPLAFSTTDPKASNELRSSLSRGLLSAMLGLPSTDVTTFISDNRTYVALFTLIYILSNNLVDYNVQDYDLEEHNCIMHFHQYAVFKSFKAKKGPFCELFCKLDLIFAAVPSKHLENLLHSRLASIRAAFETLIILSGLYEQPQAFALLVKLGAAYGWLDVSSKAQQYLILAVSMNQTRALQTLLNSGCRPDSTASELLSFTPTTAIVKAVEFQNRGCAQLLLKHCDVNKAMRPYMLYAKSNFDWVVRPVRDPLDDELSRKRFEYGLGLFFQAGADPDSDAPVFEHYSVRTLKSVELFRKRWTNRNCPAELKISVLDYLFYFHRPVFHKVLSKSAQAQNGHLSRTGVLLALDGGSLNLEAYLHNLDGKFNPNLLGKLLQQVIAEQFLICDFQGSKRSTNLEAVLSLARIVSINEVLDDFPHLLEDFVELVPAVYQGNYQWQWHTRTHDVEAAFYLLKNGATVNGKVLSWFAQLPGQTLFEIKRISNLHMKDLDTALIYAAAQNNFEAVQRILRAGVNLDGDVTQGTHGRISIIANIIASWSLDYRVGARQLPDMLEFLVKRVAELIRKHVEDTTSPCLSQPPRDWREYGYELGSDDESEPLEDDRMFRKHMNSEDYSDSTSSSGIDWEEPSATVYEISSDDYSEDYSDSTSSSGIDWEEPPATVYEISSDDDSENSEEDTGSIVSSDLDQQNSSQDAYDLDIYNSSQLPALGEMPMGTANNSNIWADQEDLSLAHEGDLTAARILPLALQDVGFEDTMDLDTSIDVDFSMDYDRSFDSEIRESAVVQDAAPQELENEGPDDSNYFS